MTISIDPIPPYVPTYLPIGDVTPLTYRDGQTFLRELYGLRDYVNGVFRDYVDNTFGKLGDEFNAEVNTLITTVNAKITEIENVVNSDLAGQTETVDSKIADLTAYVDTQVQNIIANAPAVNDPIVKNLINDAASQTRVLLDALYMTSAEVTALTNPLNDGLSQTQTDVGALKTLTNTGRLSKASLDGTYSKNLAIYAKDYGVVADGVTDDAAALVNAANAAAAIGAALTMEYGKTVAIGSAIVLPSGTRLRGNGATFKKLVANAGTAFNLNAKSDISLEDFKIDGQKQLFASNEFQHGIYIVNGCTNIAIRNVRSFNNNGDGIYIGDQTAASSNITIDGSICSGNNRNGMSISHASGVKVSNSSFLSSTGTNPQAGVDIEPNVDNVVCEDIVFVNCTFNANFNFGILVSLRNAPTVRQGNVNFFGCVARNNGVGSNAGGGVHFVAARDVTIIGGNISDNTGPGVLGDVSSTPGTIYRIKFSGATIRNNRNQGVLMTSPFAGFDMQNCNILDNGYGNPNNYPGVFMNPSSASTDVQFVGNRFDSANASYGLRINASVTGSTIIGNTYGASGTASRLLQDAAASRIDLDRTQVATVTGSRGGNAALASLITGLAARGIIIDGSTA